MHYGGIREVGSASGAGLWRRIEDFQWIKSKLRSGSILEEAPRSGRPQTVQTSGNMEAVAESIKDNPGQSIRGLVEGFGCAESTVRNLVHKDLGTKSSTHHQHHPEETDGGTWREAHFWRKEMWPVQSPSSIRWTVPFGARYRRGPGEHRIPTWSH